MPGLNAAERARRQERLHRVERAVVNELERRKAAGEPVPSSLDPDVKLQVPGYALAPSDGPDTRG